MRNKLPTATAAQKRKPALDVQSAWSRVVGDILDPDVVTVLSVYLIVLLLMLNVIFRYASSGETIAHLSAFQ